ncbi:hypothetical protein PQR53_37350 [Paraburkholderia fungorum]|uniref:hypothetical protein n=1 Tax=Paraburkholderia fungorum TaxID=134537 RepID=UPI0038B85F41
MAQISFSFNGGFCPMNLPLNTTKRRKETIVLRELWKEIRAVLRQSVDRVRTKRNSKALPGPLNKC